MSRKAFFAAFVIDEDSYAPESGAVDHHFVAADLAQSNFGEQPGVSDIVVWNSADDLVADHQQRGPITVGYLADEQFGHSIRFPHTPETCPSNHWNHGDDICAVSVQATPCFADPSMTRHSRDDSLGRFVCSLHPSPDLEHLQSSRRCLIVWTRAPGCCGVAGRMKRKRGYWKRR